MIKKYLLSTVAASLMVLTITGCGGAAPVAEEQAEYDDRCKISGQLAPEWACGNSAYFKDSIVAVGIAAPTKAGSGMQRTLAQANGRDGLARQVQVEVKNKVENFSRVTGVGDSEVVDRVATEVSKQLSKTTLTGSRQLKSFTDSKTGELYVLMGSPTAEVMAAAKEQVKSSYKNDKAMYQRFLASQASKELDFELSK